MITNKANYVAYRGPWEAETFVRERMLDEIAADIGLPPEVVRRRNLLAIGGHRQRDRQDRSAFALA